MDSGTVLVVMFASVAAWISDPSPAVHVVVQHLRGVQPVLLQHLRNHLVGAAAMEK